MPMSEGSPSPSFSRSTPTFFRPNRVPFPQTNTPTIAQTLDTSVPMDIDQNKCRSETHSCYNCNEKGHISRHCLKPRKQQIRSTESTELNLKSLVAEAVAAGMDAREIRKKAKEPKEGFQAGRR